MAHVPEAQNTTAAEHKHATDQANPRSTVSDETCKPFQVVFFADAVTSHCKIHILLEISQQEINAVLDYCDKRTRPQIFTFQRA